MYDYGILEYMSLLTCYTVHYIHMPALWAWPNLMRAKPALWTWREQWLLLFFMTCTYVRILRLLYATSTLDDRPRQVLLCQIVRNVNK